MARRSTLKASDLDRDQIAERLRQATAEGRLLAEELEERLMRAFKARTYGELDVLVADLPAAPVRRRRGVRPTQVLPIAIGVAAATIALLVIVLIAAFIITGVLAGWLLWAALGWWFFGQRRHGCRPRPHHYGPRSLGRRGVYGVRRY